MLVFRDQRITPEQQIAFSRRFGPLQIHVLHQFALAGHPEVLVVSNIVENGKPIGLGDAGHFWHSDLSYKEKPSLGSLLHAQELPREGGDTLFANMHLAWDELPAHLRSAVEGRRAEHTYLAQYAELQKRSPWRPNLSAEQVAEVKPVVHPIVRTHPETARKALFVSEHFTTRIVDLPEDESRALLAELFAHSVQPRVHLPASMARARPRVLGQPLADASRRRHARRRAPPAESHDHRRRRAFLGSHFPAQAKRDSSRAEVVARLFFQR